MSELRTCAHYGCTESTDTATIYKEPNEFHGRGWVPVCGQHAQFDKDDIEVIHTGDPAEAANDEILRTLKDD